MKNFIMRNSEIEKAIRQYMKRSPAYNHIEGRAIAKAKIEIMTDITGHSTHRSKSFYAAITIDDEDMGEEDDEWK
ncbi:MAG TPA: hypothetical protein VMU21_03645 [Thermodesulfovibrionales bacterium]|nr:hypothetical protein [Thermodesulfovibrionales bacterium]